jgi:hypothetical protein
MAIKRRYGYYPNNFDLEAFCDKYNLPAYKVVSIIDLFINKPVGQEDKRWITLNAALLQKRVGKLYRRILDELAEYEVIEINDSFKMGEYSRSYMLKDEYQYANGIKKYSIEGEKLNDALAIVNNRNAIKKYLEDIKLPKFKRTVDLPEKLFNHRYKTLIYWFETEKLSIDINMANEILELGKFKEYEPNKYLSYLSALDMINDKNYHLKCDINGRFYSSLTNLPKIFRSCLLYNGERLIGADVSNTQPLLLGELCNPVRIKQMKEDKNIVVDEKMAEEFLVHLESNPQDLKEYKKLVASGLLYESFIETAPDFDRDIVKDSMMKIINDKGKNNTREKKLIREALKQKFPTIAQLLNLLKSVDYHYASSTLMSFEAYNFVQYFPEILSYKEETKHIPIFTIHDCFLTTESNIDVLEEEIRNFFHNNLMMTIPLKRE